MRLPTFLVFFLIARICLATGQVPDLIIYEGDTLALYCNPLEDYYNDSTRPRPGDFMVSGCGTACWRGYQAVWEVRDGRLFLTGIQDCCVTFPFEITDSSLYRLRQLHIPDTIIAAVSTLKEEKYFNRDQLLDSLESRLSKKPFSDYAETILTCCRTRKHQAPLEAFFNGMVEEGRVFASWYNGDLRIPRGKRLQYVHMGYGSVFEKELMVEIRKGMVTGTFLYDNTPKKQPRKFVKLSSTTFSFLLPRELVRTRKKEVYTSFDTLFISNKDSSIMLFAFSCFHPRADQDQQKTLACSKVDSLLTLIEGDMPFSDKAEGRLRTGRYCSIDGYDPNYRIGVRLAAISNINSILILLYTEKNTDSKSYKERADTLLNSVELIEFGF